MTAYATALGSRPMEKRRKARPEQFTMLDDAHKLADQLWEDGQVLAQQLRGDQPDDSQELSERDSWLVLEKAAATLPPSEWTDPNALTDLFELRRKFTQLEHPELRVFAQQQRRLKALTPDPSITKANPAWDKMVRRLERSD